MSGWIEMGPPDGRPWMTHLMCFWLVGCTATSVVRRVVDSIESFSRRKGAPSRGKGRWC